MENNDPDFKRVVKHVGNRHYMSCSHIADGPSADDYILCITCSEQRTADEKAEKARIVKQALQRVEQLYASEKPI